MIRLTLIFTLTIFLFGCANDKNEATKKPVVQQPTPQPQPAPRPLQADGKELYPSVPEAQIRSLLERCDYVDFSFHNLPISMNQQELKDIQSTLLHISGQPAKVHNGCKEIGRALFYRDGDIALEAAIHYLADNCSYFIFYENGQAKYANFMSKGGVEFYKNTLSRFIK